MFWSGVYLSAVSAVAPIPASGNCHIQAVEVRPENYSMAIEHSSCTNPRSTDQVLKNRSRSVKRVVSSGIKPEGLMKSLMKTAISHAGVLSASACTEAGCNLNGVPAIQLKLYGDSPARRAENSECRVFSSLHFLNPGIPFQDIASISAQEGTGRRHTFMNCVQRHIHPTVVSQGIPIAGDPLSPCSLVLKTQSSILDVLNGPSIGTNFREGDRRSAGRSLQIMCGSGIAADHGNSCSPEIIDANFPLFFELTHAFQAQLSYRLNRMV